MAYGQTGSGKTYTMYGSGWEETATGADTRLSTARLDGNDMNRSTDSLVDLAGPKADESFEGNTPAPEEVPDGEEESLGIIPRAVADLFKILEEKALANPKFDYSVSCQIMQIYNEKIFDLMQDKRRQNPLQLRDNHKDNQKEKEGIDGAKSSGTVHVRGMSVYRIYSREEAIQLLKQGMRNRAIRATDFNSESSRSHTILQLFVTVEEEDEQGLMLLKRSTFSLVDLAGSEKWRSSLSTSTTNLQAEAAVQEFQQGAQSSRSRDGSVSPSGRRQIETATSSHNGSASVGPCTQCLLNDKLIAALRAKIVELHNENQVLRGVADPHLPFRAPRKPLPVGGTASISTLTKLSPSPMLTHGHGDTSSLSSVDSVQVKKKKKVTTGGKKLKRTGSKGGSRASSASGRAREESTAEGDEGEEEEEERDEPVSLHQETTAAPPLTMGISTLDPASNLSSSMDNFVGEKEKTRRPDRESNQESASVPPPQVSPMSPTRDTPKRGKTPIATPAKKSAENARSNDSGGAGADSEGSKRTSGANSLRFSDSSIEKVLKAANMVLNAPPASSLGLLSLMGDLDGVSSQPNTAEKEKIRKTKKKVKQGAVESPAVSVAPSPQKEYGERVEVLSPSPPRNNNNSNNGKQSTSHLSPTKTIPKNSSLASPLGQLNTSEQQEYLHSGTSTASNSFDSAHLRASMADYLEPSSWGNMMSPPVRKAHSNKFEDPGASFTSNSTASLGSLIGSWNGVGFADEAPPSAASGGAYASAPRKEAAETAPAVQRAAPTSTAGSGSNATLVSAAGTGVPLPTLTPARRAVQKSSNPDACAKHGLDQCVLCRMFGDDNDDSATSYNTSSYAQPAASYGDNT
eukprot:gene22249-25212_t